MTKRARVLIAAVLLVSAVLWAGAGQVTEAVALAPSGTVGVRDWLRTEEDVYFCEERQFYFCKTTGETVFPTVDPGIWTEDLLLPIPEGKQPVDEWRGKTMYEMVRLSLPPEVLARIPLWLREEWRTTIEPRRGESRSSEWGGAAETGVQPLFWRTFWSDIALVGPPIGGVQRIDFGSGTIVRWPLRVPCMMEVWSDLIWGPWWIVGQAWDFELNSRTVDALGTAHINVVANPGTYWTEGLHRRVYPEREIWNTSESVTLVLP